MSANVSIVPATPELLYVVTNMFTAYFYDLSRYDEQLVINAHGLPTWAPFGLPGPRTHDECWRHNWWIRGHCIAFLVLVDTAPAGFLHVLADRAHLPPDVDFELLDFWIAPKYRRQGSGRLAARAAFNLHRGRWQVFELARNAPALTFWHAVIGEYTAGDYQDLQGGTEQRFRNDEARPGIGHASF